MIGFNVSLTFIIGSQKTKPIITVKICYKLLYLYVIKAVQNIFEKYVTSWLQLISKLLIIYIYNAVSDWPRTFLHPGCFCLAYHYFLEV